ncbi:MAG TPA: hypothetical protein VLI55_14575 [Bryobacteraceae bacterium]|nr:hypothetical protein [Bryobacteraceae bacterium]
MHLASALSLRDGLAELNEPVVLLASDQELLEVAARIGFRVENPTNTVA